MFSPLQSKSHRLVALTGAALLAGATASAQTIDGTRDLSYPAPLTVQMVETQFGDNNIATGFAANGSELDNIHAYISGTDLVLMIGGNLESNFNKLDLFFDTKSGGQNVLGNNMNYVGAMNGLRFDAGFAADYALEVSCGNATATSLEVYANYTDLPTAGSGSNATDYINTGGMGSAGAIQPLDFGRAITGAGTGMVAINNANILGVSAGNGAANTGNAADVTTGIEYRIPLTALGTTVNGGDIKIIAFVNGSNRDFLSNQVLASIPAGGNLGVPGNVNFSTRAGSQFVTVANGGVVMPPDISVSVAALNFFNVATAGGSATRDFIITNNGGSPLDVTSITSNNAAYTVSATMATVAPAGTTTITVTFDPSVAGTNAGTLTINSNDPNTPTATVSVTGQGIAPGQVVLDGMVDASLYGTPKALQTTPTQFGDNQSELNGAYARIDGGNLYLNLTGNLQDNGNKLVLFFDADPNAGQSTFAANNPTTDNSGVLAGMQFDRGFKPESFLALNHNGSSLFASFVPMNGNGGFGTYLSGASQAFTQPLDFGGGAMGELSFDNSNTAGVTDGVVGNPAAVQTGVELRIPLSVLGAGITGTTPVRVMALITSGDYSYLSNQVLGGLPLGTGNLGADGAGNGGASVSVDFGNFVGNQFFTAQRGNLTVADTRDIAGEYNNVTVASTGQASIYSPLDVTGTFLVQGRAGFAPVPGANVTGSGATVVSGTGILAITSPDGISASGATGNVQTATRTFGTTAGYAYLGTTPQMTGSGLPATVGGISVNNSSGVTLSQALAVRAVARLQSGNLNTAGNMLTLLSSASTGTALVDNTGGVVNGTVTVQRAIDPSQNPGLGYRHYSSPVQNTSFADLATPGFTPELNTAYNNAVNPGTVLPFPNVFGYNESRIPGSPATGIPAFDKGWFVPTGNLEVGRGYTVNIPASEVVDFMGDLNNGDISKSLTRVGGTSGGWHLVGNPYPSPLDWSQVAPADRTNLNASMYVFESAGQYGGSYRSYVNGVGSGNPLIALGQGFFVRVRNGQTAGTLTFRNSQRVTDFTQQVPFRRTAADTRPLLHLSLRGTRVSDDAHVYFEAGATAAADAAFDAVKLANPHGLNLASLAGTEALAINGLPVLTASTVVPLQVAVPAAGTYTLAATTLRNLPGTVYLLDASTGQRVNLSQQASYSFTATATSLQGRFALVFEPAGAPLASQATLEAARISVFPNPARTNFTVLVPAATKAVTVTMHNSLGQEVRRATQPAATADATAVAVDAAGLAAGVYTLRVQTGASTPVTKRVVLE